MTYYDGDYEITVTTGHARGVGRDMSGYCKRLDDAGEGLAFIIGQFIPGMIAFAVGIGVATTVINFIVSL